MLQGITLRVARADELATVVSIDDDACRAYEAAGISLGIHDGHPFAEAERARWRASIEAGTVRFAVDARGDEQGVAVLGYVDGQPYLDQLAVRLSAMRRGIGRALVVEAISWARSVQGVGLWLTTYGHLPFNRPMYERMGFVVVAEREWGHEVAHHVELQRRWLPLPRERVAMRHPL